MVKIWILTDHQVALHMNFYTRRACLQCTISKEVDETTPEANRTILADLQPDLTDLAEELVQLHDKPLMYKN